jgi:hypothetical protein
MGKVVVVAAVMPRITVAAVFALLAAASAFAFDPNELNRITFTNSTGERILAIVFTPSDSSSWGPDVFGSDTVLRDGSSTGCYVHYPPSSFKFDILATGESGRTMEIHNFQMSDASEGRVTFTGKEAATPAPDLTFVTLTVTNDTGRDMQYLFVSPSDSKAWGADLMSDQAFAAGDTRSVIVAVGKQAVTCNVMCADDNDSQYVSDLTIDPTAGATFAVSLEPADLRATAEK